MSRSIKSLVRLAADYLDRPRVSNDIVLEGAVLRIKEYHEEDGHAAAPIAKRLGNTFGPDSPLVQHAFIEFVISRL